MKSFAIAILLLLNQVAHAEHSGLVTLGAKRRYLQDMSTPGLTDSMSMLLDSKSSKTKKSKNGKKKSTVITDDPSMSMPKSGNPSAKTMKGDLSKSMASGSRAFATGPKKMKGSVDASASAKSKQAVKSKDVTKGKSQTGKKSQKGLPFIKMVRSSLPKPSEEANEQANEQTNSLSSAKADYNSAPVYGATGAFIVAMCFLVGGALIAA